MWKSVVACSFWLFASSAAAQTDVDYAPFLLLDELPNVIALNGEINFRAPLAFRRALAARPQVDTLILSSGGGSVQAALLVAEEVFERKLGTLILPETQCLSACSLIFFAGQQRIVEGSLGVHQISGGGDLQEAQLNLSDILEVLAKYDVPQQVITRMLRTSPDDMYIFSDAEIASLGLIRTLEPRSDTEVSAYPPKVNSAQQEKMAEAFVLGVMMAGSLPRDELISVATNIYADNVNFYGKEVTKEEVLADKHKYVQRWPMRASTARPATIHSSCTQDICRITGVYDWVVSDTNWKKSAKGSATFEYYLRVGAGYKIIAENGKVLERNANP